VAAARLRSWLIQAGRAAFIADDSSEPESVAADRRAVATELKWTS